MSWHTAFRNQEPDRAGSIIDLEKVSVRYKVPQEKIPSLKEYVIRWLKREVHYQDFWALKNINLKVDSGEVVGIIGPNGAGKSTLLKVVARVLKPTTGRIRTFGHIAPLLELGAGFDPELTGRENIYLNGAILGYSKSEINERLDSIVEFSGLQEFIDAPLRTYSTGMFARLGFSVATAKRPDVLIVDEILGVGDAEFQTRSYERIQEFRASGTTILLVSHSMDRVEEMCSKVVWLDGGELVSLGSPKAIISDYLGRTTHKEAERLAEKIHREPLQRWGNRKIEITHVYITDGHGHEQAVFRTGEKVILHMEYEAHEAHTSLIFGIAIHHQDGTHITGPNTKQAGLEIPALEGKGRVTYTIPYLPLLEGLYHFSVAVVNQDDSEIFDYHDRAYPFRVVNYLANSEKYGLMTLSGEWGLSTDQQQTGNVSR